jgi:hypothetical protein
MNTYTKLIDKHKGEDCFILAAGPSLFDVFYKEYKNYMDMFQDKVVISVNASIIACMEHLDWLGDGSSTDGRYWVSDDSLTTRWSWWKLVEQAKCTKVVRDSWLKQEHYGDIDGFLHFAARPTPEDVINKDDVGLAYCSSMPSAIDLAIQMGCKNIYLLGLDHEKRDGKIYYWEYFPKVSHPKQFKPGKPPWNVQKDMYKINAMAYEALDKFAEEKGCNIYNCSKIAYQKKTTYQFKYKDFADIISR